MENMCNDSILGGVINLQNNVVQNEFTFERSWKNFGHGTVSSVRNVRSIPSPNDDIPSYQIPRVSKRFSDFSEEQDSVLLISPACTPPSVNKTEEYKEPLIHTIGTVVKKYGEGKVNLNEEVVDIRLHKSSANIFNDLGMMDKDISWNSSMETPAPHPLSLNDYNTIERATLLPENEIKNMQPRALFSPYKDEEIDCTPLKYSSESDDGKDHTNRGSKNNETLEEIIAAQKWRDTLMESPKLHLSFSVNSGKGIETEKEILASPSSPVFKIRKKKKRSKFKKTRVLLVKSPIISESSADEYKDEKKTNFNIDFSASVNKSETNESNENKEHNNFLCEQSNSIQDDSFQDMSFSYIDELCKNSTYLSSGTTVNTSVSCKENNTENKKIPEVEKLSLIKEKILVGKVFYENSEKSDKLRPVPSAEVFLKSAKRLEEGNNLPEKEVNVPFTNGELTVFNKMMKDVSNCVFSIDGMKRLRSENSSEKSPKLFREDKAVKLDNDWERKDSLPGDTKKTNCAALRDISSHFDANDSQICLTAAYAESLINESKFTGDNVTKIKSQGTDKEVQYNFPVDEMHCDVDFIKENKNRNGRLNFPMFSTALGNSISISKDALLKAQNIFKEDCEEGDIVEQELPKAEKNSERDFSAGFQGFKTASGSTIKINEKSLKKVKGLFKELNEDEDFIEKSVEGNIGFATASGKKLQVSEESLNKARRILSTEDTKIDSEKEENEFKKNCEEPISETKEHLGSVGFRTASNKKVEVSKHSLMKVQALWKGEEEIQEEYFGKVEEQRVIPENVILGDLIIKDEKGKLAEITVEPTKKFYGFNSASGKSISVSSKALSKAKKFLGEVEEVSIYKTPISTTQEEVGNFGKETRIPLPDSTSDKQKVGNDEEDSEELIPDWLHAYNTSPTLTMDRSHISAVTTHEDCQQYSTPREQYIVKSPVLGATDRFYSKRKRRNPGRKLIFEPSPKLEFNFKSNCNLSNENPSSKRSASDINIDFSVPFKRRKLNVDVCDSILEEGGKLREEIMEKRRLARLAQAEAGNKRKVKPVTGSHLLKKKEPQISWYEAVQGALPESYSEEILLNHGIREDVLAITANNATDYKFRSTDFFTPAESFSNVNGFPVGDGCLLIFDDENMAGFEEFARAFFASPGVEPNLISIEWVKNHYKWIVWKFSHYERAFPKIFGGNCLTPHNVLIQLKYRYDWEVDRSHRSSLKKILERDDSAAKKMVLCVSDIKKMPDSDGKAQDLLLTNSLIYNNYKLGLSDGWYCCYAQTDSAMTRLIEEGKVSIGTKLVTQGAELVNCDKGVSPLEAGENILLKISTNSTRRARWDVKLGFQKNGGSLLVPLNSILPNGGLISRIDVIITRIYPILHMEKKSDGSNVIRNSRMEDKAASAYQQQQEAVLEKIYQLVRGELKNKEKEKEKRLGKLSMVNISEVVDAEELYRHYENCSDPTSFQSLLTSKQKEILIDHQRRKSEINRKELSDLVQERIKAEKMNARKVSQLLKIRIVDLRKPNYANPALFTVWNSTEEVSRIFSEGKAISIFNAAPGNSRFSNMIQLNSTRQTRYKELPQCVDYPARKITSLSELTPDFENIFNEIDIVGIVVATRETSFGSKLSQTIYISDEDLNFAGIVFWGHCRDFGWENVLTVGSIVACSNLQWSKKKNFNNIPSVYVNDTSIFTENPKQNYFKEEIKRLKTLLPADKKSFVSKCAEEITATVEDYKQNSNLSKNSSIPNDSSLNSSPNFKPKYINGFKTKPSASSTPLKTISFGLDTSEQDPSPIQKRIEKLQAYGEPPPLSPLLPVDNLVKFKSKFRVPFKNTSSPDSAPK